LMNLYGSWIITDPVFSNRIGFHFMWYTVGPHRLVFPSLSLEDIPQIDLVLISHVHMDHFDYPSLKSIAKKFPNSSIVMPHNSSDLAKYLWFSELIEMDREDQKFIKWVYLRGVEVSHRWARVPYRERDRARWDIENGRSYNGYLISKNSKKLFFAWDTAHSDLFKKLITDNIDVAMMPIWAYHSYRENHCDPKEALQMFFDMNAKMFLPMHYETFRLSWEPLDEPINWLMEEAQKYKVDVWRQKIGEQIQL
jgi:L-ascorbate metabolism protein UlaG (beta-lactamase superfamily)